MESETAFYKLLRLYIYRNLDNATNKIISRIFKKKIPNNIQGWQMISLVFLIYIKLAIELYPEWQSISFSIEENSTRSCSIKLHFSVGFVCSNSVLDSSLHFYYIYRVCIWFKFFLPYSFHFLLTHKNGEVTGKFTSVRTRSLAERNIFLKKRNFETVQSNVIEKKRV